MYKKLISGSLALGLLLTGGTGVMAAEKPAPKQTAPVFKTLVESSAYATVKGNGSQVTLGIEGLDKPFNSKYYKEIGWTTGGQPSASDNNIIRKVSAGNTPSVTITLKELKNKLNGSTTIYGWARAANGYWYPTASAELVE
ncbi:hypothetical protein [Bacillus amyloliquefaciens]|uniref:hypothetical protein n=1 Tax=Bacillus amyloliquefaciens TaxID=1390 RepID=UPI00073C8DD0|nr:hypothetical protein [Bacillus amyloliquefaciens]KTF59733.1 hypothetical protein AR691_13450 [Bacillus amyloliquefaciens]